MCMGKESKGLRGCELEVWMEVGHYSEQMLMCVYEDQCVLTW